MKFEQLGFKVFNRYCRYRIERMLPNIRQIAACYRQKSSSTGMKYTTLWLAIRHIVRHRPKFILESGTGLSTIFLAEVVLYLKQIDSSYSPTIISMESVEEYFKLAQELLPIQYKSFVQIIFGPRVKAEYSIYRGFSHSNIPKLPYDFVLLDGPRYDDEYGSSTCMDVLQARLYSPVTNLGVCIDTRVSSVFMYQCILGDAVRYYPFMRTCLFDIPTLKKRVTLDSKSFKASFFGKLSIRPEYYLQYLEENDLGQP